MTQHDTETRQFAKQVSIKATDDDEMTATGLVLTPDEADHQLDWFDADGVASMFNPDPDDGVMHAAFPEGHSELERNEVLDADETIDGADFSAGDWVVRRKYHDQDRWNLVNSGVLGAFSMGGEISQTVEYDGVDDLPAGVSIPDSVDPDAVDDRYRPITKVIDGSVEEISDVDVGAVPAADHAVVKSVGKNIIDDTDGLEGFVELMVDRGATEDEATDLYEYMQSATKADGKPFGGWDSFDDCVDEMMTEQGYDEETARQVCGMLQEELKYDMSDSDSDDDGFETVDDATLGKRLKRLLFGESTTGADDGGDTSEETSKAGQTLSGTNQQAMMASIDAQLDVLDDAGVEHGMMRFSDNRQFPGFDVSDYGKNKNITMATDNDDGTFGEKLDEHGVVTEETLEQKLDEALGDGSGDDAEKADDEAMPEWAASLKHSVEENAEAIESIAKQSGTSTQIEAAETEAAKTEIDIKAVRKLESEVFDK